MISRYFLLIFFLSLNSNIFSQVSSDSQDVQISNSLSRLKLSVGYFWGKYSELGEDSPFLNFNYRVSQLTKSSNQFDLGFSFEAGINLIKGFSPFYVKVGPEIKLINDLILAINLGYAHSSVLFYGLNTFYLFETSKNIYLELEGGFHSSFTEKNTPIFYINFGLSIS